jgi:hypothetical protein
MWAAARVYCTAEQIAAGSKQFAGYCVEYGGVELIPYSEVLPKLTNGYIKSLPVAHYSDVEDLTVFNTSVLISRSLYKAAKDTYVRVVLLLCLCLWLVLTRKRLSLMLSTSFIRDTGRLLLQLFGTRWPSGC